MNVNNVICALLLVAKHYGSENHSLHFMAVQESSLSLLVKGIRESLNALLPHISRLYLKASPSILFSLSYLSRQFSMIAGYQGGCW